MLHQPVEGLALYRRSPINVHFYWVDLLLSLVCVMTFELESAGDTVGQGALKAAFCAM